MSPLGAERTGDGPLVVVVHGFTQRASSVAPFTALLAHRTVVAVDLPGHGTSSEISADLDGTAALVIAAAGGDEFDVVGYSLGGRVALHVACQAPATLRGTVAISANPGIEDPEARAERLERDTQLADALDADGDVAAFVDRWLSNPLFATLPDRYADVDARRSNSASGLADSLRRCSLGAQRWLVPELAAVATPVLMVAGALDDPFVAAACATAAASPAVTAVAVPGAGHVCHLEQPTITARHVDTFLSRR